ncbi:MAG: excinuclease ABC subunit UvrB [bacterium]|nr:excinuclease ABC subunit UvrB [bacterium]
MPLLGNAKYNLVADYEPAGDQPAAIEQLVEQITGGDKYQTLLGVTGSGKTFTMANVIARLGLPALIISHNKTLAAQLYGEFMQFFPESAVEYFVSFYDYYQPEAYLPAQDIYIEKDSDINDEIDRLRLRATASLFSRDDVVIVASVSCIYNLGRPEEFKRQHLIFGVGDEFDIPKLSRKFVSIHYERNDLDFHRGTFRVRGDTIEVYPAYEDEAFRLEFFGDIIERISRIDPVSGNHKGDVPRVALYPAKHHVTDSATLGPALKAIEKEMEERVAYYEKQDKVLEAHRIKTRTIYDLDLLTELGYCPGIENYSRHLTGRKPGERPACLLDYFPDDYLVIVDESHATLPQVRGMSNGDRARKETLIEHGFRLPSALDNRPLRFEEFDGIIPRFAYISATPGPYEREHSPKIVEQIIRPTGLVDPPVSLRRAEGQVDALLAEVRKRIEREERVLVTTLTKRMAEDLSEYYASLGIKVKYLHSEIDTIERVEILRSLRLGEFDVLVGVNLLREGLDLPEVTLVAILDADKEGFLRDERSIIQTAGRAARNVGGEVILYADRITGSIERALKETRRRRELQIEHNEEHGITPRSIVKSAEVILASTSVADAGDVEKAIEEGTLDAEPEALIALLDFEMHRAAEELEFEKAAALRDRILAIKAKESVKPKKKRGKKRNPTYGI